jgi:hypothetical protein
MTSTWNNADRTEILLTKADGSQVTIKKGDYIAYEGHELGVRIEALCGREEGPIGITYLPWRGERWATPQFSFRGDARFLICRPTGLPHFGIHPNWDTVIKIKNPEVSLLNVVV